MIATWHAARAALIAVLLVSTTGLAAQEFTSPQTVFGAREKWLTTFDRIPAPVLAAAFLHCDRAARKTMLNFEDGVRCAMASDALLKRVFNGNVDALIAWWLAHRDDSTVD
jgi:hypothetical protein